METYLTKKKKEREERRKEGGRDGEGRREGRKGRKEGEKEARKENTLQLYGIILTLDIVMMLYCIQRMLHSI